jgi:hypothetical protein
MKTIHGDAMWKDPKEPNSKYRFWTMVPI